jgi:hypothetical protein
LAQLLVQAIVDGHPDLVAELYSKGVAPINGLPHPIQIAALAGHANVMQRICEVEGGDALLLEDKFNGTSPINIATVAASEKALEFLEAKGAQRHPNFERLRQFVTTKCMNWACELGIEQAVSIMISRDPALLNVSFSSYNFRPIHAACSLGHLQVLKVLIEGGAVLHTRSHGKKLPLHFACLRGHFQCVQLLVNAGALLAMSPDDLSQAHSLASRIGSVNQMKGNTDMMGSEAGGRGILQTLP